MSLDQAAKILSVFGRKKMHGKFVDMDAGDANNIAEVQSAVADLYKKAGIKLFEAFGDTHNLFYSPIEQLGALLRVQWWESPDETEVRNEPVYRAYLAYMEKMELAKRIDDALAVRSDPSETLRKMWNLYDRHGRDALQVMVKHPRKPAIDGVMAWRPRNTGIPVKISEMMHAYEAFAKVHDPSRERDSEPRDADRTA
jgi:hypothetical protein